MKKRYLILGVITLLIIGAIILFFNGRSKNFKMNNKTVIDQNSGNFNTNLIKLVNNDRKENYLISPYSIEIALNMLRAGANGNTKNEIDKVIGNREINNVIIKNRIGVANAAFIKDEYKKYVEKDYYDTLKDNFDADILYDEFRTPKVINSWVNDKTNGMIKKILDNMTPDFIMGLANALAIDVEWDNQFECNNTTREEFTKIDEGKVDVEMMHNSYETSDYKYVELEDAKGIIIPYAKYDSKTGKRSYDNGSNLEFVGILPNDIDEFINSLTNNKINEIDKNVREASDDLTIQLALPRFSYEYDLKDFANILYDMGIKDAFDPSEADFTGIIKRDNGVNNLYVGEAIHKTYIDLNEKGTKAAAVTYFGMKDSAIAHELPEIITVEFNKPFIYIIRDSKTKEMLFFGTVYEPNKWKGSTCSN